MVFLAVRDVDGAVLSRADLYLDAGSGVAQIEDVLTNPAHTGRGYARAIVADGLRRARAAGCDLVFVVADAQDWPKHLYARLGYATTGRTHVFVRPSTSP
jgi:predicted GNAT family acetyltransferase